MGHLAQTSGCGVALLGPVTRLNGSRDAKKFDRDQRSHWAKRGVDITNAVATRFALHWDETGIRQVFCRTSVAGNLTKLQPRMLAFLLDQGDTI